AGRIPPTSGEVDLFAEPLTFGDPRYTRHHGVVAIYQELTIVSALSAVANVFLGAPYAKAGLLSERRMRERFRELASMLGIAVNPDARASRLSVADQQMLEIMRGVQANAKLILFDEPTTALAPPERDSLFRLMRRFRDEGRTMVLVSHNLDEVLDIADFVTVFRDGGVVASAPRAEWDKATIVRAMIGHDLQPRKRDERSASGEAAPLLTARNIELPGALSDVSLSVGAGEIVGVGGLVGSGRSSLLRSLAGLEPMSHGDLTVEGKAVHWPRKPSQALRAGIALVPEDRKTQGLVLGLTAIDNIAMTQFGLVSRLGILSRRLMHEKAKPVAREFGFAEERLDTTVRNLSGGNQQKVLLGKWRYHQPRILLVDEPTRGIDVGAKEEILKTLRRIADTGVGIVVVSSELEEIVEVSDRVIVLSEGRLVAELDGRAEALGVQDILNAAFRVDATAQPAH
ncbi:MAG: sugar ABC transporter ATP-binding protein, partial [Bauldia sp.]|nr:sugar ABC transporter ATP-binding protein [Bauldia sp.]